MVPQLLARDHQVERAGPEPAVAFRHGQPGDAEPGQLLPHRVPGRAVPGCPGPGRARHVRPAEQLVQRRAELLLLGRPAQPGVFAQHGRLAHRGRPSSRSAITVRWISLVPA